MKSIEASRAVIQSIARVRRMFALGLFMVGFLWLFVIPVFDVWQRYTQAQVEAEIRLGLVADRISSFIAANLDIWEFEGVRLPSVVAGVLRGGEPPSRLAFIDQAGNVNEFPVKGVKGHFNLSIQDTVTDGSLPVGRVVMEVPLDAALRPAFLSGGIGLASMALLLFLARMIGRKALDRSLGVIEETTSSLEQRIKDVEDARRQLAAHSASLKMANQDITHVALLTTHHLREPLRTILSYSQLLVRWHESGGTETDAAGYVGFLKTGVTRMQAQLKALSAYLELRERGQDPAPLAIEDALKVAAGRLETRLALQWDQLPEVIADVEMVSNLFTDLLAHSARSCPPDGGAVVVQAKARDDSWEIRLCDNGPPLAGRDPERMFHLLVHAEGGAMTTGLAAARLMAFLLGGELWAEDSPGGQGVTLCFTLPR